MALLCLICAASPAYRCQRCQCSAYCSTPCQETDYPTHKLLCKTFARFAPDTRPSVNHRRAIYAPVNERQPRLIWVQITPDAPGWDGHDEPHLDQLLKLAPGETGYIGRHPTYIRGNKLRGRPENDHTLELWQRDDDSRPLPPANQSLNVVDGHAWSTWRGPLVTMSKAGTDFDPALYVDVTLNDFRDMIDYIYYFRETSGSATDGLASESHWGKLILSHDGGKTRVVRVACRGDQVARGLPAFSIVEIPKLHPAFRSADDPPSIAEVLGISVSVYKEKAAAAWRDGKTVTDAYSNPAIASLYCYVGYQWSTSKTTMLGGVPDRWSEGTGTALVLNRNKSDLSVEWVRTLCELCESHVMPLAHTFRESGGDVDKLHDRIRREIKPQLP